MIENFEFITKPLTRDEKKLLPFFKDCLKKTSKKKPLKNDIIIIKLDKIAAKKKINTKVNGVLVRKLTHYCRKNSELPIMATSLGYYTSSDYFEIKSQIKSLLQRAYSIEQDANGLEKFIK